MTTKNDPTIIQCAECDSQVSVGGFTEQELIDDSWLLGPVVYCPACGPDDELRSRIDVARETCATFATKHPATSTDGEGR